MSLPASLNNRYHSPTVSGYPTGGESIPGQTQRYTLVSSEAVSRNFSYPTGILTALPRAYPQGPVEVSQPESYWNQLGQICSFTPEEAVGHTTETTSTQPTAIQHSTIRTDPEAPFFLRIGPEDAYEQLVPFQITVNNKNQETFILVNRQSVAKQTVSDTAKKVLRSILFPIQSAQAQSGWFFTPKGPARDIQRSQPKDMQPWRHASPVRPQGTRAKRASYLSHKTAASFDACQALIRIPSPPRPASSCGNPSADAETLKSSTSRRQWLGHSGFHRSQGSLCNTSSQSTPRRMLRSAEDISTTIHGQNGGSLIMNSPCRASSVGPTAMAVKDEKKEKGKWLKQFKTWLFASEPSTQTLQQHKKDSSRKSGLDPDDARGTPARLDTSIGAYQAKAIG